MVIRHVWMLDPGKTTGFVTYDLVADVFTAEELQFQATCTKLMSAYDHVNDGIIIGAERFIITPATAKNTQAPWSLELIGVARMVSELYLKRELVLQQAAAAKRFSSDTRLKHMGWYTRGKGHANDAARHLLLLMASRGLLSQDTLNAFAEMA